MCGIIGMIGTAGKKDAAALILDGMETMKNRGKDGAGIASGKDGEPVYADTVKDLLKKGKIAEESSDAIGHLLHSMISRVKQPIKRKGILSVNCEIYNWRKLRIIHKIEAENDAELLFELLERIPDDELADGIPKLRNELDGVYSFVYQRGETTIIARDILGVKPLWYTIDDEDGDPSLAFASEKKALHAMGLTDAEELNPRHIIIHTKNSNKGKAAIRTIRQPFFELDESNDTTENTTDDRKAIEKKTEKHLLQAIQKRLPDPGQKLGILFSGGIDSTILAHICKHLGREFVCYTAALEEDGMGEAQDLAAAQKAAEELGFDLKVKKLDLAATRKYLEKIIPLIEDTNVVKAGVALTLYAACERAKEDGVTVILSGLGSEEIFAGYERHKKSHDINKECLAGLRKIYERDLYRDDVLSMDNNIEMRLPFLDRDLVEHALTIPASLKLNDNENKIILRDIARKQGVPEAFAARKKKAAQYGSKFDRALQRLAKKEGFKTKSAFLRQFYQPPNVRLGVLWSGGKDSAFAAWTMMKQNYEIGCLISLKSKNDDSYMFHTPNIDLVELHAQAMNKSIIIQETAGEKEKELNDLKEAIRRARDEHGIQGIVTGALYSNYQRERIEKICDELEMKIFSPLWHIDQEKEMRQLIDEGFSIIFSSVAAEGLDKGWL
ncbi:MAG: diphthine--ammonia ligase, partial [Nanoarchaeota archaeon]